MSSIAIRLFTFVQAAGEMGARGLFGGWKRCRGFYRTNARSVGREYTVRVGEVRVEGPTARACTSGSAAGERAGSTQFVQGVNRCGYRANLNVNTAGAIDWRMT